MLLGIDAGAHVGIMAASRMPLFKAIVLVSPIVDNEFIDALTKIEVPSFVAFGAEDEHGNSTSLSLLREEMFDRGRRFNAVAYKNAHRYFFNALHPQYDRKAMNAVLNEALRLFHSVL
jgi:dienelactone hydrolase